MIEPRCSPPPDRAALGSRVQVWGNSGRVRERFWPQLMVWRRERSLLWWIWTQHARKRRELKGFTRDARFEHVRFVRFTSTRAADSWLESLAY